MSETVSRKRSKSNRDKAGYWYRLSATLIGAIKSGAWAALKPAAKAVYPVLWSHANKQWRAWPEIETICAESGLGASQVYVAIAELERLGFVRVERRGRAGRRAAIKRFEIVETHIPTAAELSGEPEESSDLPEDQSDAPEQPSGLPDEQSGQPDEQSGIPDYKRELLPLNGDHGNGYQNNTHHMKGDRPRADAGERVCVSRDQVSVADQRNAAPVIADLRRKLGLSAEKAQAIIAEHGAARAAEALAGFITELTAGRARSVGMFFSFLKTGYAPKMPEAEGEYKPRELTAEDIRELLRDYDDDHERYSPEIQAWLATMGDAEVERHFADVTVAPKRMEQFRQRADADRRAFLFDVRANGWWKDHLPREGVAGTIGPETETAEAA